MPRQVRLPDDEEEATATPPGAISGAAPQAQTGSSAAQTQPIPSPTVSAPPAASPPAVVQQPAQTVTPASNAGPVNTTVVNQAKPPATAAASPGTIALVRPGNQMTSVERRQHSISCLQTIAAAFEKYRAKNKRLPDCYYHVDDQPHLSWRVELLPYMGYTNLFKKFNYDERWDGPTNRRLLAEIPPVYQSPERGDERTNFLLSVGSETAYVNSYSGPINSVFEDGQENTIVLLEADDARAVPWTKPEDRPFAFGQSTDSFFTLREDGFFAVMGNGAVRLVPSSISEDQLMGLLTARGKESVNLAEWTRSPTADVDEKLAAAFRAMREKEKPADPKTIATTGPAGTEQKPKNTVTVDAQASQIAGSRIEVLRKPEVPEETDLKAAEALVKKVYGDRYAKAKSATERREIATLMISEAETMRQELPSYYTMLRIARDIATASGDMQGACSAMDKIESTFTLDLLEHRLPWLDTAAKHTASSSDALKLAERASSLLDIALEQDAFNECRDVQTLWVAMAKKSGAQDQIKNSMSSRERIDDARRAYSKTAEQLHVLLREPNNPKANLEVGKYLCFVKRQWDKGLSHLAKGSEGPLKEVAALEMQRPATPDAQALLADTYWSLSETPYYSKDEKALQERAVHWYRIALPQQPDGLRKALIQERLRVAETSSALAKSAN